jgi:hypothetical protein
MGASLSASPRVAGLSVARHHRGFRVPSIGGCLARAGKGVGPWHPDRDGRTRPSPRSPGGRVIRRPPRPPRCPLLRRKPCGCRLRGSVIRSPAIPKDHIPPDHLRAVHVAMPFAVCDPACSAPKSFAAPIAAPPAPEEAGFAFGRPARAAPGGAFAALTARPSHAEACERRSDPCSVSFPPCPACAAPAWPFPGVASPYRRLWIPEGIHTRRSVVTF